jgi:hypothetical protein
MTAVRIGLVALLLAGCRVTLHFAGSPDATMPFHCVNDDDCPLTSLHCESVSGQCLPCASDANCGSATQPRCDAALHICVQCGTSQDCASGWQCEPTTRTCVESCASSLDCGASGTWCSDDGTCAECDDDHECASSSRPFCDPATDRCAACVYDAQCSTASPHCNRTIGRCVRCTTSSDCDPGTVCDPTVWNCILPVA